MSALSQMKFGLRLIQYVGTQREIVELSVAAEAAGFDYLWYPHDPFMSHTWVTTAAVAARTRRARIGSVGTNPYTTHPSEIATYIATLDELSEGRAVLGLGLHTTDMVAWTGFDTAGYLDRTREATTMIRGLLKGETVAVNTAEFQWSDQCYLRFQPFRDSIPIYICPFGADYLQLSGEIGDGSLPMIAPPESARVMVPPIHAGAKAAGRDVGEVDIAGCAWLSLSEDGMAAAHQMKQMIAYFGPYMEADALATVGLGVADFAAVKALVDAGRHDAASEQVTDGMLRLGIAGTPADVTARIEAVAEAGITQINLGGPIGPDPYEAIRLMGNRVIPHFR